MADPRELLRGVQLRPDLPVPAHRRLRRRPLDARHLRRRPRLADRGRTRGRDGPGRTGRGTRAVRYDDDEPGSPWSWILYLDERATRRAGRGARGDLQRSAYGGDALAHFPWAWKASKLRSGCATCRDRGRPHTAARGAPHLRPLDGPDPRPLPRRRAAVSCVIPGHDVTARSSSRTSCASMAMACPSRSGRVRLRLDVLLLRLNRAAYEPTRADELARGGGYRRRRRCPPRRGARPACRSRHPATRELHDGGRPPTRRSAESTASPRPPSGQWSSTVTIGDVASTGSVSASIGLTE